MPPSSYVFSYKGIDYFVFFEDHPDPHFTVFINGEIYKFRISDLACISGSLPGEGDWLKILKGAKKNKQKLSDAWNANAEPYLPKRKHREPMPKSQKRARRSKRKRKR